MLQFTLASSKFEPQKKESTSSHGVDGKQSWFSGQSADDPLGHGTRQLVAASVQLDPQKKEDCSPHGV